MTMSVPIVASILVAVLPYSSRLYADTILDWPRPPTIEDCRAFQDAITVL
jgi:hypothetical protein